MSGAQLHLLVNHVPVIVPAIGVLVLGVGLLLRSSEIRKVGLWLLVLGGLSSAAAYLTGEPAQRVVQNYPDVSRIVIHEHEEAAEFAFAFLAVTGAASLLILGAKRLGRAIPRWAWGALLALAVFSCVVVARSAHLGGKIRHEEIRNAEFL